MIDKEWDLYYHLNQKLDSGTKQRFVFCGGELRRQNKKARKGDWIEMKKKVLALVLALAMAAAMLTGCSGGGDSGDATTSDTPSQSAGGSDLIGSSDEGLVGSDAEDTGYVRPTLTFNISQFSVDPTKPRNAGQITYSVYEMLYTTENGIGSDMIPLLADANRGGNNSLGLAGMDHEDGSTEYIFYIYDYITDSAGNHITASDVKFSFEKCLEGGQESGWGVITGWEVVDDTTLKMTTTRELNLKGELENIVLRTCIFSEKAYNDSPSSFTADACGTGPYKVTGYEQDYSVTCTARDDYWQTNDELRPRSQQANVAEFTAIVYSDDNTKSVAMRSGDIDVITQIASTALSPFQGDDNYQIYNYMQNGLHYLDLNVNEASIMSDPNMRLAIYYAINNEGLATMLNASGVTAYDPVVAFGHDVFADYLTKWESETTYVTEYNVDRAKELAAQAGYNGEEIVFLNASDTTGIVENVLNMLTNAGFNVKLASYDRNTVTAYLEDPTQWDIYYNMTMSSDYMTSLWSHVMDPDSFGGHTENFIVDDQYTALLEAAQAADATDDDVDAFWQYTLENAYFYPLVRGVQSIILPTGEVTSVWMNDKNNLIPGACYYAEP
jgi:ABC-type transport system substrate-binding protein